MPRHRLPEQLRVSRFLSCLPTFVNSPDGVLSGTASKKQHRTMASQYIRAFLDWLDRSFGRKPFAPVSWNTLKSTGLAGQRSKYPSFQPLAALAQAVSNPGQLGALAMPIVKGAA